MSHVKYSCPFCSAQLESHEELFGQLIDCPACKKVIEVPYRNQTARRKTFTPVRIPETLSDRRQETPEQRKRPLTSKPAKDRNKLYALCALIVLFAVAVYNASPFEFMAPYTAKQSDPVTELQGIANRIDGLRYVGWKNEPSSIHSVFFDVRKTESLVSPFIGSIRCILDDNEYECIFAYQNAKWELKMSNNTFLKRIVLENIDSYYNAIK